MTDSNQVSTQTPATDIPFNFGRASNRDLILFTCQRPGGDPEEEGGKILADPIQIGFMKKQGIEHVLVLLDDNEMEHYEEPGLLAAYEGAGFVIHRQPMAEEGASQKILNIIQDCENNNAKIAAHCTHGLGRSGRVAAGWLAARYKLSPQEATEEALEFAKLHGIERLGNVSKLTKWLNGITSLKLEWKIFYDLQCNYSKKVWDKSDALQKHFEDDFIITRHFTSLAYHLQAFPGQSAAYYIGLQAGPDARRKFEHVVFAQQDRILDAGIGTNHTYAQVDEIYAQLAEEAGVFSPPDFTKEDLLANVRNKALVIKPTYKEVKVALGYGAFGAPAHVIGGRLLQGTESSWEPHEWEDYLNKNVFQKE